MKKITKESIKAFYNREPFKKSNMIVENIKGVTKLKLHNITKYSIYLLTPYSH